MWRIVSGAAEVAPVSRDGRDCGLGGGRAKDRVRNRLCSFLAIAWAISVSVPGSQNTGNTPIEQACSAANPGATEITFNWPAAPGAHEVWLDLSLYSMGFDGGAFVGAGPFGPKVTSYTWTGIAPSTSYHYRVNALYDDGWHALKFGSFISGQCGQPPVAVQSMSQQCSADSPGMVAVSFAWSPSLLPGGTQYLDLSMYDTGFAAGTFVGNGPLPGSQSALTWDGLIPASVYYWRVNTSTANGWYAGPTWSFGTLSCGSTAASAVAPNPAMLQLRDNLAAAINDSGFNVAVAVTDLQTGESIDVKGDDPRYAGCTANWFVLLSNVIDLQERRYPEGHVGDLISRTIWGSNPITAHKLLIKTGGSVPGGVYKLYDLMARLGMRSSIFDHPPAYEEEFSLRGLSNIVTANDVNRALAQFYHGGVVNLQWRDYLMEKMTHVKPGLQYLLPAGVGNGVVSHKNGFSWVAGGWIDNDIGIVTFNSNGGRRAYAISLYMQDIGTEYADISIGQTVSRMVWRYFADRYP